MKLSGKVALVTGSGQGIGQAIAIRLGAEGASVVINYRSSEAEAQQTLGQVEAAGGKGFIVKADAGVVTDIRRLIDESVQHFGQLDILVNNAGVEKNAPFWEVSEDDYDKVVDINLKGVFFSSQVFVQHLMATRRPGKIINISSVHEELPFPNFAAYCASKGGLKMLARNLAVELGPLGITVNNIAPGAIETPINAELLKDRQKLDALLKNIPLGRLGRPEDVAAMAAFLASSEADYVTGTTFFIDGGLLWNYQEQ